MKHVYQLKNSLVDDPVNLLTVLRKFFSLCGPRSMRTKYVLSMVTKPVDKDVGSGWYLRSTGGVKVMSRR